MSVLSMAATGAVKIPPIVFDQLDRLADFHAAMLPTEWGSSRRAVISDRRAQRAASGPEGLRPGGRAEGEAQLDVTPQDN